MSTDRELLEMAAKAAGILTAWPKPDYDIEIDDAGVYCYGMGKSLSWNPLEDDGDALRLAVKLGIDVFADLPSDEPGACNCAEAQRGGVLIIEDFDAHNGDVYAATRRAIVRAAAEIGRNMP